MPSARVLRLSDAPGAHAAVAEILNETWPGYYGPGGPGDAAAHVAQRAGDGGLPVGFVALVDEPLGTATLAADSFGAQSVDKGPWLIGLAVRPVARRQGVGDALVGAIEDYARALGEVSVLTTTRTAKGVLVRRGWQVLRDVTDPEGMVWQVFRKVLR